MESASFPAPSPSSLQPSQSHEDLHSTVTLNNKPNKPSNLPTPTAVPWSTGLCDCCDDCHSCCLTCCCPCITFGRIAEIVDRGSTSCGVSGALYMLVMCVTGCPCMYSCFYRSKLRGQYLLKERPCSDCCVHCCCEACALCQEYRELKNRGFKMAVGWHANMDRKKPTSTPAIPPQIEAAMSR
ncbi:hypothetical protein HRI_002695900 [Hibiscus trionum]|uniref:Uncharacterized protein n=1 Tax=Hibiscus trionum TaxID=183268 RepID=A0A9W7I820_HIBTR|nr:hypothetical protein HRI_002695900 [Hibiscus trionum]